MEGCAFIWGAHLCLLGEVDQDQTTAQLLFFFFFGCQIILSFSFSLQFLTSWALHSTTVDAIYDVMRVAAINIAAHRLGDLFNGSREFSS